MHNQNGSTIARLDRATYRRDSRLRKTKARFPPQGRKGSDTSVARSSETKVSPLKYCSPDERCHEIKGSRALFNHIAHCASSICMCPTPFPFAFVITVLSALIEVALGGGQPAVESGAPRRREAARAGGSQELRMHFVCRVVDGTDGPCQTLVSHRTSSPVTELINHTDVISRCWFPSGHARAPVWTRSTVQRRMLSFTHHPVVKAVNCVLPFVQAVLLQILGPNERAPMQNRA